MPILDESVRFYDTAVPTEFLESRCKELLDAGRTAMHEIADTVMASRGMQMAAGKTV